MRVAMFTETFLPSTDGVVTRLLSTLPELARLGHEVLLLAPDGGPSNYAGTRVEGFPGKPFFLYPDKRVIWPRTRALDLLREFRPDLIHTVNPVIFGWGAIIASRRMHVPLLASYHTHFPHFATVYGYRWATGLIWTYMRLIHNRATMNLCTSEAARADLVAHGFRRVRVWDHGIDLGRFRPKPADPAMRARLAGGRSERTVLVYVGRLAPEKQIERLLPLVRRDAAVALAIVGDGPCRPQLERLFAGTATTFLGKLHGEDLVSAYTSADALLFPSTMETLGLVLLEAMACGLPVLAGRSAPTAALVRDGAGILYDADDPSSLDAAVARLRADPGLRARLAAASGQLGSARGWDGPTRQLVGYYREALQDEGAEAPSGHLAPGDLGAGGY